MIHKVLLIIFRFHWNLSTRPEVKDSTIDMEEGKACNNQNEEENDT